jgi:type IV pilus assembly protein PilQ
MAAVTASGFVGNQGLDTDPGSSGPILDSSGQQGGTGSSGTLIQTPTVNDRYMVNLPIANPAGKIAMTLLDSDYIVDLEITAAQTEGRGEIISAPRVITANGKEASIEQGVEIPYQESASSGATTTQFKKAVLSLKVTPQITPDDRVILDLTVSKDNVGELVSSATGWLGAQHRHARDRHAGAGQRRPDGRAGRHHGDRAARYGQQGAVPGRHPGLGVLFRNKSKTDNKDELLIFVTPKILREGANIY